MAKGARASAKATKSTASRKSTRKRVLAPPSTSEPQVLPLAKKLHSGRKKVQKISTYSSDHVGALDDVPCFQWFKSFDEMFAHGIHCSTQAGIAGKASGATSVVLNSGYSGDGEAPNQIIMDGQGGRARLCTEHSFDQSWDSRGNAGLRACWQSGAEVRVCRGWRTRYGPTKGYRYDGCWTVVNAWQARAPDGFLRCRFHLIRLPEQPVDAEHGMPQLSLRLLQELERIKRARDPEHADREMQPKVYEGGRVQPRLLVEKKGANKTNAAQATAKKSQSNTAAAVAEAQAVIDGAPARKRKQTEKEWEEMPATWDGEKATMSRGKKKALAGEKKKALVTPSGEKTIASADKPASTLGAETPSTRDEEIPSTSRSGRLLRGNLKGKSRTAKTRAGGSEGKAGQSSETRGEAEDMSVDEQAGDEEMNDGHACGEGSDDPPRLEAGDDGEDHEMADASTFGDQNEDDPALYDEKEDDAVFDDGKSDDDTLSEQMALDDGKSDNGGNALEDKSDDELARLLQVTVKKEEDGEAQVYATVQEAPRVVGRATAKVGPPRKKRKSQEAEAPSMPQAKRSKLPMACASSSQTSSTACSSTISHKEAPPKRRSQIKHQQRTQPDSQAHSPSHHAHSTSSRPTKATRAKRRSRSRTPPRKPVVRLTVSASPSPGP